jgi:hypothetical protein
MLERVVSHSVTEDKGSSPFALPCPNAERAQTSVGVHPAAQFDDRFRMIIDAKVADPIDAFSGVLGSAKLLHDKGSRLLSSPVSPGSLSRFKRCHHPLGQRVGGLKKCALHPGKDVCVRQHVSLHRESILN